MTKFQILSYSVIGLLLLILGITGLIYLTRDQESGQVFPATINRDCAPWDGSAFTVSISHDSISTIEVSIWKSPDIKLPTTLSFPDESGRIGNAVHRSQIGLAEQLTGKLFFWRVEQGTPIEGEFNFTSGRGGRFEGKFRAEWGNQIAMCG
jgi:hypothetical protein